MTLPDSFNGYLVQRHADGSTTAAVTRLPLQQLPAGDVLIRVAFSSLNYKDALSATGHPGVTRQFPHVPGIDAAGHVAASASPDFRPDDPVLVTGYDLGQNTWGGWGQFIRVPAQWVVPLPPELGLRQSMVLGTAGLTAALSIEALVRACLEPAAGPIIVTGASGGVGSLAVAILARLGYQVAAVTGKPAAHALLGRLGAATVLSRRDLDDTSGKPLLKPQWAGGVDTVGGNTLATLLRSTAPLGCVAACGLVGGADLPLTVYPFILRGVTLAGIDSANCPMATRRRLWNNLAGPWRPTLPDDLVTEIDLPGLERYVPMILAGGVTGRIVVRHGSPSVNPGP